MAETLHSSQSTSCDMDFLVGQDLNDLQLSLIVPTFNEAANIGPLLDKIDRALTGISWEIIFVDDNSPDGTSDVVRAVARRDRRVRVVQRVGRRGLSSAVIEGALASSGRTIGVIDA